VEVSTALVRYVNEGNTIGAVNMPEVNLRSLTLEDPNSMRVIYIHKNVPGVLRQGKSGLLQDAREVRLTSG
jgi:D-3-phosphoglycerate dehydrogenase